MNVNGYPGCYETLSPCFPVRQPHPHPGLEASETKKDMNTASEAAVIGGAE